MAPIAFVALAFVMGCSDDDSGQSQDAGADQGGDGADDTRGPSGADTFGMGETSNGQTDDDDGGPVTTLEPDPDTTFGGQTDTGDDPEVETTSVGFIYGNPDPTDGGDPFECDILEQDCPRGEKCNAWANDGGGAWNATRCVPVADNPDQPGEPCEVQGSGVSGFDSCDLGSMCWEVDPETNIGECVAMCTGDADDPVCDDPDNACAVANEGAIMLCLPGCMPGLMDCEGGQGCYPIGDVFVCLPQFPPDGGYGDGCTGIASCDPGLTCIDAALVPGCETAACCTDFCDVTDEAGDAQCLGFEDGSVCTLWYEEDPPAGYENLGVCVLPVE